MASSAVKFSPVRKFHLPTDLTTFSGLIQESLNSGTKIKKMNKKREYYFFGIHICCDTMEHTI